MSDFYPVLVSEPDARVHIVRFVGGAAAVTKVRGRGITIAYVGAGIVDVTWSENPGVFAGPLAEPSFQATVPAGVKGYTCVPGVYNVATKTLRLNITNAAEALTDLAALQWLTVALLFVADGSL